MLLFMLFFPIYILTMIGNIILIYTVVQTRSMHTPMYYFLCNLAFLDLFFSTSTVPKLLVDLLVVEGRISYIGCMLQMCISLSLGMIESILLAVIACDRFLAICNPLRYTVIMSWKRCKNIIAFIWIFSFLSVILPTVLKPPYFCREKIINHFLCEVLALIKLACGDTSSYETSLFFQSLFTILTPFSFIVMSYICILKSVLKIRSVEGRTKAFSTCASHLTVVIMFYVPILNFYLGPSINFSSNKEKYLAIFYGILTPMLNPLIYSLRNSEVKKAVSRILICSVQIS
ncbi:hypothetical protein XELAEV_18028351mg [Xenopus laevis]|uniref:Olfactory receptor n=1 Tax=Xenopus laevis TaxID=8355 RepID=A0A974HKX4_XENLA|nr:hypothetical protein XELAEV_18028351mg [Xenopus laevis]